MPLRAWALAPACARGVVWVWGCDESGLCCQKPAAGPLPTICWIWSHVVGWPLRLVGQGRTFKRLPFMARVPEVSTLGSCHRHIGCTYSWSLHQRLFGEGPGSVSINSRNPQLVLTPLPSPTLSYRFVPAWRAVTCVRHVWQSERVLEALFLK